MAFNIVTAVQERMGFDEFEKIDPAYQQTNEERPDHYAQAATIAVLTGLYKYAQDPEGAVEIAGNGSDQILDHIFKGKKEKIMEAVGSYDHDIQDGTSVFMQKIAQVSVEILHNEAKSGGETAENIQSVLSGQRHNILSYLPPDLHMGSAMNDQTLDDRTNKMEGPVSNLVHFVEDIFSEKVEDHPVEKGH